MIVAPAMPKPSQRRGLRAAYARSRQRRPPPHHRQGEARGAPRARLRRLRRPPGAHRLRADAALDGRGLLHLPHALRRDDPGRACTRAASSRSSSAASSPPHHHRREPLPRRPPHHRPRHPRGGPERRRPPAAAWRASSASTTWASGRRRCSTPTGSSRAIIRGPEFQRKMTTPEFHYLLGKDIARDREAAGGEAAVAARPPATARRAHLRRRGAGRVASSSTS